ncbi:Uncharacterized protein T4A_9224, partial [Trichinella pseudospiralis]
LFSIITLIATSDDDILCRAECDTRIVPAFAFTAQQLPLTSSVFKTYANPDQNRPISPKQNVQQNTILLDEVVTSRCHQQARSFLPPHCSHVPRYLSTVRYRPTTTTTVVTKTTDPANTSLMIILRPTVHLPDLQVPCPCAKQVNEKKCSSYDSRYLAVDLEEAIIEFPDLMMMQVPAKWSLTGGEEEMPYPPAPPYPVEKCLTYFSVTVSKFRATAIVMPKSFEHPTHKPQLTVTTSSYSRCRDIECQFCSFMLTQRLREMGLLSEQQYNEIRRSLGFINGAAFPNVAEKITCKRFRFSAIQDRLKNLARKANNTETVLNSTMAQALQSVSHLGLEEWNRTESNNFKRFRREISDVEIGKRYRIDCIKRGEPVDGSEWLGLCNVCWVWRKLPENYFPRYVNELVCDNDTKCLSGWGTCKQRQRNLEIMKNMGTAEEPQWRPITLNAASFCDCFVRYGTHLLIKQTLNLKQRELLSCQTLAITLALLPFM